MANIFTDQENAGLNLPSFNMRQRLKSAPEKVLKSPLAAKTVITPLPSGRKALGIVNKKVSTPAVNPQGKKLLKPQETKLKPAHPTKVAEYPEMEKFSTYDPLEFEKYSVPEDLIPLSCLALPGLGSLPQNVQKPCEEDLKGIPPLPNLSPMKMPQHSGNCSALDAFLQTLDELTVDLPPELSTDFEC